MNIPTKNNQKLQRVLDAVNANAEIKTLWDVVNVNAVSRLGMSDHGSVHVQIVANIALRLLRILNKAEIETTVDKDYIEIDYQDTEVVVFLASISHDLGMSIQRDGHEEMSLFLVNRLLNDILRDMYPVRERTIIISEVLHAIIAHRSHGKPLTLEAGIIRVADALDMAAGRSRISFDAGEINIHSVSAIAIKKIDIESGTDKPIHIIVHMENSAGIFQVDGLFHEKIVGSGLEGYLSLSVINDGTTEKKIVTKYEI